MPLILIQHLQFRRDSVSLQQIQNIRVRLLIKILSIILLIPMVIGIGIILNYHLIAKVSENAIYYNISDLPFRKYTMVLGAGSADPGLWENHSFDHRMEAAVSIYKNHKTEKIIVSGISNRPLYNEPNDMKKRLMDNGIPFIDIYPDHGGIRTFISVQRTRDHYHTGPLIIISQQEQLERAIFSAKTMGIDAIGFAAEKQQYQHRFWTVREYLSRVKCTLDAIGYTLKM